MADDVWIEVLMDVKLDIRVQHQTLLISIQDALPRIDIFVNWVQWDDVCVKSIIQHELALLFSFDYFNLITNLIQWTSCCSIDHTMCIENYQHYKNISCYDFVY